MNVEINEDLLSIMLLYSLSSSFGHFRYAIEFWDQLPDAESLKIEILEAVTNRITPPCLLTMNEIILTRKTAEQGPMELGTTDPATM